jgi:tetratricopeptide (TPR) repeat protein
MRLQKVCNRIIEYAFYLLFLAVPLFFTPDTSELFEFNKLWLTFWITIVIVAAWIIKMIASGKFKIQRTILDIPILLFLLSQIISTIISIDPHTSIWGYYSRFNGGLLSIISYILLYYAFVSNLNEMKYVKRVLKVSLLSGFLVTIWGLPSHFGHDLTCYVFRGTFDVSCWTAEFHPELRMFSTMGQPDWLAAYLSILIPISAAFSIAGAKTKIAENKIVSGFVGFFKTFWAEILYMLLALLFYLTLMFTISRSGVLATWASIFVFAVVYFWLDRKTLKKFNFKRLWKFHWSMLSLLIGVILITFFTGRLLGFLGNFNYEILKGRVDNYFAQKRVEKQVVKPVQPTPAPAAPAAADSATHVTELGGTDSTKIRAIVWTGAIKIWEHYPIFGSGVETFAFSYYKYKPAAHNLTSEWNFLYNKAHNEYLNYLATTGAFGLLTYLAFIFFFFWFLYSRVLRKADSEGIQSKHIFTTGLAASVVSILVSNFFGFSVVIVNIYLFTIPAFAFILASLIDDQKLFGFERKVKMPDVKAKAFKQKAMAGKIGSGSWILIIIVLAGSIYLISRLYIYREADKAYALGSNYDRVNQYQQAYSFLHAAYSLRPQEPVIADETAYNDSVMAVMLLNQDQQQKSTQSAGIAQSLAQEAVTLGTKVVKENPNNVVFWKTQTRIYYTLAQVDPNYLPMAFEAIKTASQLAPTDANIWYNYGILSLQNGKIDDAISILDQTIKLKPDYRDAYYALGITYHQQSIDKTGKVINQAINQKAIDEMNFILKNVAPGDPQAQEAIKTWSK